MLDLQQKSILVVEDEPLVALGIQFAIEDHNGVCIGPAVSIAEALGLIHGERDLAGAILDVNLPDGDIGPVLAGLIELQVVAILHTGAPLPDDLRAAFPKVPIQSKPTEPVELLRILMEA